MKQKAYTLIECLIVLVIIAVLLVLIVHFDKQRLARWEVSRALGDIHSAIDYARTLAIVQGRDLYLAPVDKKGWSSGLILYEDVNHNFRYDPGDRLHYHWRFKGRLSIDWQGFSSSQYLRFSRDLTSSASSGRFTLQHQAFPSHKKVVIVNRVGRRRSP